MPLVGEGLHCADGVDRLFGMSPKGGDRVGGVEDPFGYRWFIATHKEDLTMDEIRRRAAVQAS